MGPDWYIEESERLECELGRTPTDEEIMDSYVNRLADAADLARDLERESGEHTCKQTKKNGTILENRR